MSLPALIVYTLGALAGVVFVGMALVLLFVERYGDGDE